MKKNIIIIDDHKIFADGIISLLEQTKLYQCTSFVKPSILIEYLTHNKHLADIIISDISLPEMSGLDLFPIIKKINPDIKIIFLSMHHEVSIIKNALKLKPEGYFIKNVSIDELLIGIEKVIEGGIYYTQDITPLLINNIQGVNEFNNSIIPDTTNREREIIQLLAEGYTTQEIADMLYLSFHTIETYRKSLMKKFNVKNSINLVSKSIKLGVI